MKREDILFILDRAHGYNVSGKQSPDGSFKEWKYSDKLIDKLIRGLNKLNIPNVETVPEDYEVGLIERVKRANKYSENTKTPIFISLHNNAGGGTGNELYIKRNPSKEEIKIANIMSNRLIKDFPDIKWRQYTYDNLYKEANYTVLTGDKNNTPIYIPILVEFLFMDHKDDILLLKDDKILKKYVDSLLYGIVEICNYFGYGNFKLI